MLNKCLTTLVFLGAVLAQIFFPQPASAELVTGKDWIGFFAVGSSDIQNAAMILNR